MPEGWEDKSKKLGATIYRNSKTIGEPHAWLGDRKVYVVDASDGRYTGAAKRITGGITR
jgi:hypothetical protein